VSAKMKLIQKKKQEQKRSRLGNRGNPKRYQKHEREYTKYRF
jgi:hypothetical protein